MATNLETTPKPLPKVVTNVLNFVIPENIGVLNNLCAKARIPPIHELEQGYLGSGSNVFNTWTDGALRVRGGQDILAIVEVKKRDRERKQMEILMQEGAEMVAWLMRENDRLPDLNGHRIMVSQNCDKIWVTFASCHQDYIEYIQRKGKITKDTFLTMETFGPFKVNDADDMKDLAVLITAITLKA